MKRVKFHPGMKFNLKERQYKQTIKFIIISQILKLESGYVKNIRRLQTISFSFVDFLIRGFPGMVLRNTAN